MESFLGELLIKPGHIPVIVAAAVGIHLGSMVLARAFGAVGGRVILGHPPTLAAGLVGLSTLMVLEMAFGTLRRAGPDSLAQVQAMIPEPTGTCRSSASAGPRPRGVARGQGLLTEDRAALPGWGSAAR